MPTGPAALAEILNCFKSWAVPLHEVLLVQDTVPATTVGKLLNICMPATPAVAPDLMVVPEEAPEPSAFRGSTLTTSPTPPDWLVPIEARSPLMVRSLSVSLGRFTVVVRVEVAVVVAEPPVKVAVPTKVEPS